MPKSHESLKFTFLVQKNHFSSSGLGVGKSQKINQIVCHMLVTYQTCLCKINCVFCILVETCYIHSVINLVDVPENLTC